jgi:2-oxoglutarate ferredoxin oxidoreductase subunit beta
VLERAAAHRGSAFVEIFQNCNIFNDKAFDDYIEKAVRDDRILYLEHDKPMIFGNEVKKGIRLTEDARLAIVDADGVEPEGVLRHDEGRRHPSLAFLLSRLDYPDFPVPIGVFRAVDAPCLETSVRDQITDATDRLGEGDLEAQVRGGETWTVS